MPREVVTVATPWLITGDWDFSQQGVQIIAREDKHFNSGADRVENQWCNGTVRCELLLLEANTRNTDVCIVNVFYNRFSRAFRRTEVK